MKFDLIEKLEGYYICVNVSSKKIRNIHLLKKLKNRYTNWVLYRGDEPYWASAYSFEVKNKDSEYRIINEKIYNKLLGLSTYNRSYVNITTSEVDLFRYWGILDEISEQLI